MSAWVAINGFGRIGRQPLKALIESAQEIEVVGGNDLVDLELDALLFTHSTYGQYAGSVEPTGDTLVITPSRGTPHVVRVLREKDPAALPWRALGKDLVRYVAAQLT